MLKVVSLDMDGTLVRSDFVNAVWLEGIPALYASQYGMDLAEAKRVVFEAYGSVGEFRKEWYNIGYWFRRFDLKSDWQDLLKSHRHKVDFFPEVEGVVKRLKDKYSLIIVSNAAEEFLDMELDGMKGHFDHIFSCVSHFDRVKKDASVFNEVCRRIGVAPGEVCHVGDNYDFDYLAPMSAGIPSCFVDRTAAQDGPFTVRDLKEFEDRLPSLGGGAP